MSDPLSLNRRNALFLAAGGLAATGLGAGTARAQGTAPAEAGSGSGSGSGTEGEAMGVDDTRPFAPGWRRFQIGEARITVVLDGVRPGEGPFPTFGEDQTQEAVGALMARNGLPRERFVNFFNVVIVELGGQTVLVDTGFGEGGRANGMGLLRARMEAAGFSPGDIDVVALTHLHGDHINGLREAGEPAFPNARYAVGREEMAFWTSDEARNGPRAENARAVADNVAPFEARTTLLADGEEVVPGMVARAAFGHTPGQLAFAIGSGETQVVLTADIFSQFVISFQRPDWHVRFDQDKTAAAETRRRFASELADSGAAIIGYHLPFPGLGYVEADGEAFRFVPETYQSLARG